jgi:hypothetical protein
MRRPAITQGKFAFQPPLRSFTRLTAGHAPVKYEPEFFLTNGDPRIADQSLFAEVAELADAHGSGPCTRKGVGVRVPSSAPMLRHFL